MWADTLMDLERSHLLRLFVWGAGSALLGTLLLASIMWRRMHAPLLKHFAIQTAAWGAVILALGLWSWQQLALRDYGGLQHVVNLLWLNVGLNIGYVGVGATLALTAWRLAQRAGAVGAGIGIIVQGLALLLFDLRLLALIGPLK